jgi:hypothetical protein
MTLADVQRHGDLVTRLEDEGEFPRVIEDLNGAGRP